MKTWEIILKFHITDENPDFDPREWHADALFQVASARPTIRDWTFTELVPVEPDDQPLPN